MEHKRHNFISLEGCLAPLVLSDVQVPQKDQRECVVGINRVQSNYPENRVFRNTSNKKQTDQTKLNQTQKKPNEEHFGAAFFSSLLPSRSHDAGCTLAKGCKDKKRGERAEQTHMPKGHVALPHLSTALQELWGRDSKTAATGA